MGPPLPSHLHAGFHASLWRLVPLSIVVEYLRGNGKTDDNECAKLFKDYQKCLHVRSMRSLPLEFVFGWSWSGLLTIWPIDDDI